ncbi:unnamed protein product [marine sediment metagenome]|uniref:Uncharacterized protein n=1 Tax=marine sediment metagenome TaxID=412755 RepID=X1D110_9ZZZZ
MLARNCPANIPTAKVAAKIATWKLLGSTLDMTKGPNGHIKLITNHHKDVEMRKILNFLFLKGKKSDDFLADFFSTLVSLILITRIAATARRSAPRNIITRNLFV